jgi:hypothetical protein
MGYHSALRRKNTTTWMKIRTLCKTIEPGAKILYACTYMKFLK